MPALTTQEVEATARFAVYERLIEFLIMDRLCRTPRANWEHVRSALLGSGAQIASGIISVDDLARIDMAVDDRIEEIYGRAEQWALRGME